VPDPRHDLLGEALVEAVYTGSTVIYIAPRTLAASSFAADAVTMSPTERKLPTARHIQHRTNERAPRMEREK